MTPDAGDLFRGRLDRPTLAGLGRLLDRLADAMAGAGVSDSQRRSVGLVADELLSNVLNHREGRDRPHVEIALRRRADAGLELEIADDGPGFDPFSQADPRTDLALEARPVGGLGLLLVKSLCAERSYERRGERNFATLVFPA